MTRIPITGPSITPLEVEAAAEAARHGWYDRAFEFQERFEKDFAHYLGVGHAAALSSGTAGIHLALLALGIGPGDEVVVPDLTWIASAAPITYLGAETVFADVESQSWCLDPASLEACLTPRTRAVIAVDLYGSVADYPAIRSLLAKRGIPLIEDAAQALGSERDGRQAGSFGDLGVFSFHGTKTLTTGEGGMLVCNDDEIYHRVLALRDHGRQPGDRSFLSREIGYKYKMSAMQAALGTAQLSRIGELIAFKRRNQDWYREALAGLPGIGLNPELPGVASTYWLTTLLFSPESGLTKEDLVRALKERGIDSRPFFYPLSSLPAFDGRTEAAKARARNELSYRLSPRGINLPSAMSLTREQVSEVAAALGEILR